MNKQSLILALVILGLGIFFWLNKPTSQVDSSTNDVMTTENAQVKSISTQEFDQLVQNSNTFVLDVHTPEQTHIPGTDAFIDYTKINQNQDQLPQDKNTPVIVYCRSGNMSAQAAEDLLALGYTQVYDLQGGTDAYKQSGKQAVTVSPDTQPLGTVIYGDVPETQFMLTNYTDNTLQVTRLSTSCGCTKAFMDQKTVEPFSSAPIRVTFNPAVHKDDTDLGDLTRTIYIETNNPQFAKLETTITATVVKK